MSTTSGKVAGGFAAVVLGLGAAVAHHAGLFTTEVVLLSAKNAHDMRSALDDIGEGSYVKSQMVSLFCSASSSLAATGHLPDEATNWRAFVKGRLSITDDSNEYFTGKLQQLETAEQLAERNPRLAIEYVKACAGT